VILAWLGLEARRTERRGTREEEPKRGEDQPEEVESGGRRVESEVGDKENDRSSTRGPLVGDELGCYCLFFIKTQYSPNTHF
jgi:hypothetical protein